jgi:hypothetical protein
MKKLNTLLQYREPEYFLGRKPDELFVFETVNPMMKVAKLMQYKTSAYFDYTGMQIKAVTTPSVALSELNGLRVYHLECPQCTGTVNAFYGLECTPYVGVMWDGGLGHLKLPANYFWNDVYDLILL